MSLMPKNIQLSCKDRSQYFLHQVSRDIILTMGNPHIIYMGNKYGTISVDKNLNIKISNLNVISKFAYEYIASILKS